MFAFANEIAMLSSRLDVNIEEVIAVVNTDYDRNHIPNPGFVSGYCLGKDPYIFELDFMKHAGRDFHSLWYYGRKTNDYLVDFIVNKTLAHLKNRPNPRVTLLGLAFKEDVDDFRMSHAFLVMNQLIAGQVNSFQVYDPNLSNNRYTTFAPFYSPYISLASNTLTPELFTDTDAIIICVRHQELVAANNLEQLNLLLKNTHIPCYLYDGWDIWQNASTINSIEYEGIGFKQHTEKS
jgi:UDP-N-acetyl-D-mannosaminuronic acid dehydrogenase